MKKLFTLLGLFSLALLTACDVERSDVKTEMGQMAIAVKKLSDATGADEFHQAAQSLRDASVQAMAKQPSSIDKESDFAGYQEGMKQFIAAIDKADALAQHGKLDDAKRATQRLFELKKEFHVKYK